MTEKPPKLNPEAARNEAVIRELKDIFIFVSALTST
jgi:hypothetical protein